MPRRKRKLKGARLPFRVSPSPQQGTTTSLGPQEYAPILLSVLKEDPRVPTRLPEGLSRPRLMDSLTRLRLILLKRLSPFIRSGLGPFLRRFLQAAPWRSVFSVFSRRMSEALSPLQG